MSADALTVGCKRNVTPEMAELKGKRLIIAAELEEGMRLNTSTVKQLCSTDEIEAEKKYKDPFKYWKNHPVHDKLFPSEILQRVWFIALRLGSGFFCIIYAGLLRCLVTRFRASN